MSWTQEFHKLRANAATLSEIQDFHALVKLAETVGRDLHADGVSSRQIRGLLSETTVGASRIRSGRTLGGGDQNTAAAKEAALLNISLVYAAARDKNGSASLQELTALIGEVSRHVKSFGDFKILRKFAEAIIAYYKFAENNSSGRRHGGR